MATIPKSDLLEIFHNNDEFTSEILLIEEDGAQTLVRGFASIVGSEEFAGYTDNITLHIQSDDFPDEYDRGDNIFYDNGYYVINNIVKNPSGISAVTVALQG